MFSVKVYFLVQQFWDDTATRTSILWFLVVSHDFPLISLTTTGIGLRHTPDESRIGCPGGGTVPRTPTENDALVYIDAGFITASRIYNICIFIQLSLYRWPRNFITVQIGRCFVEKATALGCCRLIMIPIVHYLSYKKYINMFTVPFWILPFIGFHMSSCGLHIGTLSSPNLPDKTQEMSGLKETVPFEKRAAEAQRILRTSA